MVTSMDVQTRPAAESQESDVILKNYHEPVQKHTKCSHTVWKRTARFTSNSPFINIVIHTVDRHTGILWCRFAVRFSTFQRAVTLDPDVAT